MKYLHTMVRVTNIEESLKFYRDALGLQVVRQKDYPEGKYTLVFLAAPGDAQSGQNAQIELTYNWGDEKYSGGRNFGHLAYEVDDIYALCQHLQNCGIMILRPPRDGRMAFIRSPDGISIELLQKGAAKAPSEPWLSMQNSGSW
ncbi:MAG: lactoylglutathione lyase [Alphaproteobacteria bacterium]|nr:lactoylglutathione lyase [Alphaproteobacteria bacterium]